MRRGSRGSSVPPRGLRDSRPSSRRRLGALGQRSLGPGFLSIPRRGGRPAPSSRAAAGRRQGLRGRPRPCPGLPPGAPLSPDKAVPRLQRFQFGLLRMNHPPFPAAWPPFRPPPPEASVARVPAGAAPPRRLGPPPGPGRQLRTLRAAGLRPGGLGPGWGGAGATGCVWYGPHGREGAGKDGTPAQGAPGPPERRVRASRSRGASSHPQSGF